MRRYTNGCDRGTHEKRHNLVDAEGRQTGMWRLLARPPVVSVMSRRVTVPARRRDADRRILVPHRRSAMAYQFDVVVEKDSAGNFVASVPALPGCHTQARSLDELMTRVREAIELCLEEQGSAPEPLDFVGVQRVTVNA